MDRCRHPAARSFCRFPRRRGDGPYWAEAARAGDVFSPQARGWTLWLSQARALRSVFPAGAGMDPHWRDKTMTGTSFPRRRGDGPLAEEVRHAEDLFSPQARGWTATERRADRGRAVFPAGAGMDPFERWGRAARWSFPRRRGDGPARRGQDSHMPGFSPQARGWTVLGRYRGLRRRVFPAGAGMDHTGGFDRVYGAGFPRRRGDGPPGRPTKHQKIRFSPQARGWTSVGTDHYRREPVFPAGAGMDPLRTLGGHNCCRFPRRRGDGPHATAGGTAIPMFSPQARGWTPCYRRRHRHP